MTQAQNLANLSQDYGVIPMSCRNYIVDGACEYVQGGATVLSGNTSAYTCNMMWLGGAGVNGAATINNQSARTNGLGGDSGTNGLYAHSQTTASTGSMATYDLPCMFQRVEFVNKLAGKSVTLSMKLLVASGSVTVPGVFCRQSMGTGGSPSPNTTLDKAVSWNVTTTQKKFSVRLDLPTVQALTLGTNNNDFTSFGVFFPPNWTGTMYVTEVQVEISRPNSSSDLNGAGGEPTAFEYRGWSAEYARIMRYYETGQQPFRYMDVYPAGGSAAYDSCRFMVPKRQPPALSVGNTWQYYSQGNNTPVPSVSFGSYVDMLGFNCSGMTNWRGWTGQGTWVADCRL